MTGGTSPRLSRRGFLGVLSVAAIVAACSSPAPEGATRNVRDHGAVGDGEKDDSAAITAAVAELKTGDTLLFPRGTYRFGLQNPSGDAAISITGLSGVTIEFEPGAELLMDNLAPDGSGTSHGIVVRGPATDTNLRGVAVRWATAPAQRSMGDGIRIVGYPSDSAGVPSGWTGSEGPVSRVSLRDCRVQSSPQAGVIMMGVFDLTVSGLRVRDTLADGLHFNACRRGQVTDYEATDTGDDGLALVTYYTPEDAFDNDAETFSLAELTDWSNADLTVNKVTVNGGNANGVRISGVNRATLTDVNVRGVRSGAGLITDSAAPGSDADWDYLASRGVRVEGLTVDDSDSGLHVLGRPLGSSDDRFSDFDVDVSGVTVRGCPRWSVLVESVSDKPVAGVRLRECTITAGAIDEATGIVGLQTTRDVSLGNVTITSAAPAVALSANDSNQFTIDNLRISVSGPGPDPRSAGPLVQFQDSTGSVSAAYLEWPQAPSPWEPILVSGETCRPGTQTASSPVQFGSVDTTPTAVIGSSNSSC